MRSGWPHTQDDHGRPPADQRHAPFGPEISWPTGYSDLEYRDGDYRYPVPRGTQPPANQGQHPYAAFSAAGYGDDGYRDPGYDGPASQDAGIAGTRTVRGFVESGQEQAGYGLPSAPQSGYAPTGHAGQGYSQPGYTSPGYGDSGHIELAYPLPPSAETYPPADGYRQAWDYDQPLRYEGEEPAYPAQDSYRQLDRYQRSDNYPQSDNYQRSDNYPQPDSYQQPADYGRADSYGSAEGYGHPDSRAHADNYDSADNYGHADGRRRAEGPGSGAHRTQAYSPADYNGSDYSMPGVNGPGYDLSGIIGTGDFEALGYDQPSYDRLSYDDPRYDPPAGYGDSRYDAPRDNSRGGFRSDETRFDVPRFDETRLDSLWLADDKVRHDDPVGYENDGFGTDSPVRSGYADFDRGNGRRFEETRLDLRVGDLRMDHTRFDVPAFDETRIDNMRALGPATALRPAATGLLAPPDDRPRSWADETSLDTFSDLDLEEELAQAPAAFVRTTERRGEADDDTGTRRAVGRRRGRSGDRRQWMALGAIAVVAAGAIGGVLMKFVSSGPSGPAHTVVAPNQVDAFTRMPNLEKQMKVDALRQDVMKTSAGQATDVVSAVYQEGSATPGGNAQIFMFVGGKLSSAAPATSLSNFTATYPGARVVPAGALGGNVACAEAQANGEGVAMCVWFDNDSFGELVSPTMTTAKLATTLDQVRPNLELYAK